MLLNKSINDTVKFCRDIVVTITRPAIMGLMIRFQRAQVQLLAREENTIKILETIKRANILEIIFILTLTVSNICIAIGLHGPEVFYISKESAQVFTIIGNIFDITFICIFCFSMYDVNLQLALFFNQVDIKTYTKKLIAFLIGVYFVI